MAEPHVAMRRSSPTGRREAKVLGALRRSARRQRRAAAGRSMTTSPPRLKPVAARSLLAHLLKLQADGAAVQADGAWRLI